LLLADPSNPRSLRYQIDRIDEAVSLLPGNRTETTLEQRTTAELGIAVRSADLDQLAADTAEESAAALQSYLADLLTRSRDLADQISNRSFSPLPLQRPFANSSGGDWS